MRERTRFECEVEDLFAAAPREAEVPGVAPAWPPKALKTSVIFRHWRSVGSGPVILTAADLDPVFADHAQTKSCLDDWRKSTAPSAQHSHVALVDLSHTDARYAGIRDKESVDLASSSKAGIMYPAFQLRRDVRVLAERDKPATAAALFAAVRDKWATDLVDGGHFGNRAGARGWVNAGADGIPNNADDILIATGETVAQVQARVLAGGPSLFTAVEGYAVFGVRFGWHRGPHSVFVDFENLGDQNYRGISWGMDAPGRGVSARYSLRF